MKASRKYWSWVVSFYSSCVILTSGFIFGIHVPTSIFELLRSTFLSPGTFLRADLWSNQCPYSIIAVWTGTEHCAQLFRLVMLSSEAIQKNSTKKKFHWGYEIINVYSLVLVEEWLHPGTDIRTKKREEKRSIYAYTSTFISFGIM